MTGKALTATAGQILELVRTGQVTTRRELQQQTGLSRSTLALRLAELTAGGYLRESGQRSGPAGRPAGMLSFVDEDKYILVADLGATHARFAMQNAAGFMLAEVSEELRIQAGPELVLQTVRDASLGAGLILHGQPERGVAGGAGDIGHIRIAHPTAGVRCACGATGCLAAHASGGAFARQLTERGVPAATSGDVVRLVQSGNAEAIALVRTAGQLLGEVLATAVAVLNPAVLIIGGAMAGTHEHFLLGSVRRFTSAPFRSPPATCW